MNDIKLVYFDSSKHINYTEASAACEAHTMPVVAYLEKDLLKILGYITRASKLLTVCIDATGDVECGLLVQGIYMPIDDAMTFIKGVM